MPRHDPLIPLLTADDVPRTPHVLIVDDNDVNRAVLRTMLGDAGYELTEAANGTDALQAARERQPDLILLDVMMPGLDGYATCAELKRDPETRDVPVIFLSALAQTADRVRGLELGALDWVTKPFDRSEVLVRVRNQIRIATLTQQLCSTNRELVAQADVLREDLAAAADIQRSLIPRSPPALPEIEAAWRFFPCDSVGGDIFHLTPLDEDHLALSIVDVSGHGVPAAMVTVSVAQSLSPHAGLVVRPAGSGDITPPRRVLELLDREYPFERFEKFFTIGYAVLDLATGVLRYSGAAHPYPAVLRRNGTVELLEEGGTIIGLDGAVPFVEGKTTLERGDRLFLYTDGVIELQRPGGEAFGEDRLTACLAQVRHEALGAACDVVVETLRDFAGGRPASDDVTLLALEYRGREPSATHERSE